MKLTLCGSAKFVPLFDKWNDMLSSHGHIVYSLALNFKIQEGAPNEQILKLVHLRKIDESAGIVVINDMDYIGESTKMEILYALLSGKNIFTTMQPSIRDWGIGEATVFDAKALLGFGKTAEPWMLCQHLEVQPPPFQDKDYLEQSTGIGEQASNGSVNAILTPDEARLIQSIRKNTGQAPSA
jgi:hypothetical protein